MTQAAFLSSGPFRYRFSGCVLTGLLLLKGLLLVCSWRNDFRWLSMAVLAGSLWFDLIFIEL